MLRDLTLRSAVLIGTILSLSFLSAYHVFSNRLEQAFQKNAYDLQSLAVSQIRLIEPKQADEHQEAWELEELSRILESFWHKGGLRQIEIEIEGRDSPVVLPRGSTGARFKTDFVLQESLSVHGKKWKLRFFFSKLKLFQERSHLLFSGLLILSGAFVVLVFIDLLLLFFYYRRPIRRLSSGISRIAAGNWDHRIPLSYQDDVNEIILNINELAAQFQMHEFEMQISNAKHRIFVENSSDVIFSMNEDGILITVNKAIRRHLGYAPSDLKGKPFEMLINYDRSRPDDVRLHVFREKLREVEEKGQGQFKVELVSAHGEPREMNLRLEFMKVNSAYVYWGKLEPLARNVMGRLCVAEYRRFCIGNYLNIADMILNVITMNLERYFSEEETASMKIGVREMIINAIEHGNLGITYEEKARATTAETYLQLVTERQKMMPYQDRKVQISYSLNSKRVRYFIRDEGEGFDHQKMRESFKVELDRYHGRGIVITDSIFDVVRYNAKGNEVLLIKYAKKNGTPSKMDS